MLTKIKWRPGTIFWSVTAAVAQVVIAVGLYTRGFSKAWLTWKAFTNDITSFGFSSTSDILVANVASAVITILYAFVARCAPLFVYGRMRRSWAVYAGGSLQAVLASYSLAKVFGAPAEDDWFWGACVLLFSGGTMGGFLISGIADRVHTWALSAAARRLGLPDPQSGAAKEDGDDGDEEDKAEQEEKARKSRASLGRLLSLSRPDAWYIFAGFINLTIAAVAGTFTPHFTGACIDAIAQGDSGTFRLYILYLLGAAVLQAVFTGARGWCFTIAIARLKVRLRDRLFRSLMTQEQAYFDTVSTGELTSRLASDTTAVGDQVSLNVNVFARSLISAVGSLVFMFALSWRLTLLAFCTVPPTILISQIYGRWIQKLARRSQQRLADCNRVAEEALGSMLTVRAFGGEQREADRHGEILADFYMQNKLQADGYAYYAAATTFLPSAVTAAVLYVGGHLISSGGLSSGTLISFLLYQLTLAGAFASMSDIWSGLQSAVGAADKIFSILDREPRMALDGKRVPGAGGDCVSVAATAGTAAVAIETAAAPAVDDADTALVIAESGGASAQPARLPLYRSPRPPIYGRIDLENVSFAYPSRPEVKVLDGFSLTLLPGQTVALVGMSGGGKSSICKLVQRLYEPLSGRVLLDGIPLREYDHEWLHRALSTVNQEPVLFARSIWENITYAVDMDTEEGTGGPRALIHLPPSAQPKFVHYRPAPAGSKASRAHKDKARSWWRRLFSGFSSGRDRAGSDSHAYAALLDGQGDSSLVSSPGGLDRDYSAGHGGHFGSHAWSSDLSTIDNTPAIIDLASARGRLVSQYRQLELEARRALTVKMRLARARKAGLLAVGDADDDGATGAATTVVVATRAGSGKPQGTTPEGRRKSVLRQADAALSALCPRSRWDESEGQQGKAKGRGKGKTAPKSIKDQEKTLKRQRRVREWIRQKREQESGIQALDRSDQLLLQLLKEWHGTGSSSSSSSNSGSGSAGQTKTGSGAGEASATAVAPAYAEAGADDHEDHDEGDEDDADIQEDLDEAGLTLPTFTPTPDSMRQIVAAARAANAHSFISKMPDGYDTQVGERGVSLSGGQKQRVAIARAVLRAPSVLLLDEATSALDAESEYLVQTALDGLMSGRTTLVIAHRLSTVRRADVICVVSGGRVVESGRHEELVARPDGAYAALVRRQLEQAELQQ